VKPFPLESIPLETMRVARTVLQPNNWYIQIGDQLPQLLAGVPANESNVTKETSNGFSKLLAMITLFQAYEHLTDHQAEDAGRMRIDWKYALHLPMVHPGIKAHWLCDFRLNLYTSAENRTRLQQMINNMRKMDLWKDDMQIEAEQVVESICTLNRIISVRDRMAAALEVIAIHEPEWLRGSILAHWYSRYSHRSSQPPLNSNNPAAVAAATGKDILYLLTLLESSEAAYLASLPEIEALRRVLHEQYELTHLGRAKVPMLLWRETKCVYFNGNWAAPDAPFGSCYEL
jgi:transposase